MNKTQAWLLIVFVGILIALWLIHNSNESQAVVNSVIGCDAICDNAYMTRASSGEGLELDLSQEQQCQDQCSTENGLPPISTSVQGN